MKVKIFTECGEDIGYGHISRCIALYEEIQCRNINVELIIYGEINNKNILKGKIYRLDNWLNKDYLNDYISKDDYTIVDSYLAGIELYQIVTINSKRSLFIDDNNRIIYPKSIIVNPSLDISDNQYSYLPEENILTGSKYVILRSAFRNFEEKKINERVNNVIVIMGGTDIRGITTKVIKNICEINHDISFDIIVDGIQYANFNSNYKLKNVKYHKNLSESRMKEIMSKSDIAISAAGQTIYELLASKTPFIAIQVAQNQEINIKSLKKKLPSQIVIKYNDDFFIEQLQEKFIEINDFEYRKNISEEMKDIIDEEGPKRIIDVLLKDVDDCNSFHLRKVKEQDINKVFQLSNEDYVRRYSLNKNLIRWEDHIKWFDNILNDSNVVFYVISDLQDSFLGQIRFNIEHDKATISISISNEIRGKGFSKSLVKLSIEKLFAEKKYINNIIAYVSKNNNSSISLFKGLNFRISDENDSFIKFIFWRA